MASTNASSSSGAGSSAAAPQPAPAPSRMIRLRTSDGEVFEVEESLIVQARQIKNMIDADCADGEIPLYNVTGPILRKVIEYLRKHSGPEDPILAARAGLPFNSPMRLRLWDEEFLDVDQGTLFDLMMAANYLNIKSLVDCCCRRAVNMMKGRTAEQIREIFRIVNDYSPEEEQAVRMDNPLAFAFS